MKTELLLKKIEKLEDYVKFLSEELGNWAAISLTHPQFGSSQESIDKGEQFRDELLILTQQLEEKEPEKVFSDDIDTIGHCANCGVEFHIHKEQQLEEKEKTPMEQIREVFEPIQLGENSVVNKAMDISSEKIAKEQQPPDVTAEEILKKYSRNYDEDGAHYYFIQSTILEAMDEYAGIVERRSCTKCAMKQSKAPDKEIIEEELDLMQYVTNLLYAAYRSCDTQSEFDEWVETNVELLKKYAQSKALPEMSDSEIEKHFTSEHYDNSNGHHYRIKKDRIFGAKWYRDRNKQRDENNLFKKQE